MECASADELREFRAEVEAAAMDVEARISAAFKVGDVDAAAADTVRLQYQHKLLQEMQGRALHL